jgi:hypothetical protein
VALQIPFPCVCWRNTREQYNSLATLMLTTLRSRSRLVGVVAILVLGASGAIVASNLDSSGAATRHGHEIATLANSLMRVGTPSGSTSGFNPRRSEISLPPDLTTNMDIVWSGSWKVAQPTAIVDQRFRTAARAAGLRLLVEGEGERGDVVIYSLDLESAKVPEGIRLSTLQLWFVVTGPDSCGVVAEVSVSTSAPSRL